MKLGTDSQKNLFCNSFIKTHREFVPEELPWPELSDKDLQKLRGVPFWQEVLYTEMRAIKIIAAFSETITDPQIREAIKLMEYEEQRHERLIRHLIARYGVVVEPREIPPLPANVETAFIDFGFGECVDSFLGFGFFKIAREERFLPEPLFEIFDLLMSEETRHVLLIVNWMAYREAQHGRRAAPLRACTSAWYYGRAVWGVVNVALRAAKEEGDGQQFSATQAGDMLDGITVHRVLSQCVGENIRRMATFEPALLRPRLLPSLAQAMLVVLNAISAIPFPRRQSQAS